MIESNNENFSSKRVCLLGASFNTGNLGVSALAESSIKCILNRWPDAEITILRFGRDSGEDIITVMGNELLVRSLPVRFSPKIFVRDHFLSIAIYGILSHIKTASFIRKRLSSLENSAGVLYRSDIVVDISGGDSFSDIYGIHRFLMGYLKKSLAKLYGKKLMLLPQTYGPFKSSLAKYLASRVVRYASIVLTRDEEGAIMARELLADEKCEGKIKKIGDVAFVLDSRKPAKADLCGIENASGEDAFVVGLNINGLLFNGGYTKDNMFGLKADYRELVVNIVQSLMNHEKRWVLLVPHVIIPPVHLDNGWGIENDEEACRVLYDQLKGQYPDRLFMAKGGYDQGEIKHIIGNCDFFIGSRMHSCIAALSQCIPAVGLAYSKKFKGVFETVGMESNVLDLRHKKCEEILTGIDRAIKEKDKMAEVLKQTVPSLQKGLYDIFKGID